MQPLDKNAAGIVVTVLLAGIAFAFPQVPQLVGWLLIALAGLLALRWMVEGPTSVRLARGLRLLENKPHGLRRDVFASRGLFVSGDEPTREALQTYRFRRLTLRTDRQFHRLRFACTGPIYTKEHELKVHKWQENLPPTDVFLDLPDENIVEATFLPAPFAAHHELIVTLGSTADFRVTAITAPRFSVKAELAGRNR